MLHSLKLNVLYQLLTVLEQLSGSIKQVGMVKTRRSFLQIKALQSKNCK